MCYELSLAYAVTFVTFSGETNEAKLALQILCLSFSGKGCSDMLTYIYEGCDVSFFRSHAEFG